jgi:hypothetical protein
MEKKIISVLKCENINSGHMCQQWKKNDLCLGRENRVCMISQQTN